MNVEKTSPAIDNIEYLHGHFKSETGSEQIYYRSTTTSAKHSLKVLILHDFCDYHGRHNLLPFYLLKNLKDRVQIHWMDFKGHGLSTGTRGLMENFDDYVFDVIHYINSFIQEDVIILGQGMGALAALRINQSYSNKLNVKIKGLILSNPSLKLQIDPGKVFGGVLKNWESILSRFKVPYHISGDMLTSDSELAHDFDKDPLVQHKLSTGLYTEVLDMSAKLRNSSYFVDIPTLTLVGERDSICDSKISILYHKGVAKKLSSIKVYADMRHDLFSEKNRRKVYKDVLAWLKNFL